MSNQTPPIPRKAGARGGARREGSEDSGVPPRSSQLYAIPPPYPVAVAMPPQHSGYGNIPHQPIHFPPNAQFAQHPPPTAGDFPWQPHDRPAAFHPGGLIQQHYYPEITTPAAVPRRKRSTSSAGEGGRPSSTTKRARRSSGAEGAFEGLIIFLSFKLDGRV